MRPSFTAASAASASGSIFTNHCVEIIGSTISPPRCERGMVVVYGSVLIDQPGLLHVGPQLLAALEAVLALVRAAVLVDLRGLVQHRDDRQVVALRDVIVVRVVPGRDLQRAGAELLRHVVVGDHRDLAAQDRHDGRCAR